MSTSFNWMYNTHANHITEDAISPDDWAECNSISADELEYYTG